MNAKKILLTLFSFLLLVLLISLVNAQEDFVASSKKGSVELCPCSNQAYSITIQNTGSTASSYTVLAGGSAVEWVNFNPSKFILNPNEKGSFFVFVNSRCNIEGDYDLEIFVTTNNGLTKVIRQTLKFSKCYDFSLEQGKIIEDIEESVSFLQHDGSYSLCKDEQKSIPILITNNENFENRYKLFLDAPEWAALNVDNVRLDAKKLGVFFINFDTTDVEEGEYNFKLIGLDKNINNPVDDRRSYYKVYINKIEAGRTTIGLESQSKIFKTILQNNNHLLIIEKWILDKRKNGNP